MRLDYTEFATYEAERIEGTPIGMLNTLTRNHVNNDPSCADWQGAPVHASPTRELIVHDFDGRAHHRILDQQAIGRAATNGCKVVFVGSDEVGEWAKQLFH
jgi:hypothetical protein